MGSNICKPFRAYTLAIELTHSVCQRTQGEEQYRQRDSRMSGYPVTNSMSFDWSFKHGVNFSFLTATFGEPIPMDGVTGNDGTIVPFESHDGVA